MTIPKAAMLDEARDCLARVRRGMWLDLGCAALLLALLLAGLPDPGWGPALCFLAGFCGSGAWRNMTLAEGIAANVREMEARPDEPPEPLRGKDDR